MKQLIGTYQLGSENVRLMLAHDDGGGCFWGCPEKGLNATIEVSAKQEHWWQVMGVLLHEVTELAYFRAGLRFAQTPDYARDNGNYLFVMGHTDFSEANARAAHFLAQALPDFAKAWNKWKAAQKK